MKQRCDNCKFAHEVIGYDLSHYYQYVERVECRVRPPRRTLLGTKFPTIADPMGTWCGCHEWKNDPNSSQTETAETPSNNNDGG